MRTVLPVDIIGGIVCVDIPIFLQHRQEPDSKLLVFPIPALSAMLPKRAHDENVGEVERFFDDLANGITLDVYSVFVGVDFHLSVV